jgi:RNA polymerase sigma-70 factor (ECF subfamily)
MEDQRIIDLYYERNEQAIEESNNKYGAYCHTIAWNVLNNRESAEECVNDTWWQSWKVMPPQLPGCLRAFFGRITRNLALDRYRCANRLKRGGGEMVLALEELGDCLADDTNVEQQYELKELGRCINRFLLDQSKRDRDLFLCRYYYVYPMAEMARKHGLTENHVRSILSRMRRKLRIALEMEGYRL